MKIRANVTKVNKEGSSVKAYADITLENCCTLYGMRVVEGKDGQLFAAYPQKPVYENGQPKLDEEGKAIYADIYHAVAKQEDGSYGYSRELNEAIKKAVMDAYSNEKGYAYHNPTKGEVGTAKIEPQLHKCEGNRVKAAGNLLVGGYMQVNDVFVNLCTGKDGGKFLAVSYPSYKSGDSYRDFVEPLEKGKIWDREAKVEKDYDFKGAVEGAMKKQTREFHPELAEMLKSGKVADIIADATAESKGGAGQAKAEREMEPAM